MICTNCGDDLSTDNRCPKCDVAPQKPSRPDPFPGYRIDQMLGRGGTGTVFLATQLSLGRQVAIKELASHLANDAGYVANFLEEARAIAGLQHENIVRAIDRGQTGSVYFTVMEYVEGETIAERLKRDGALPERDALAVAAQIAEGLRYAHGRGVLHRDIKPRNVIIGTDGKARICDFGLAHSADVGEGRVLCSPAYASPESLKHQPVDHRGDIYSLGVTLFEMLTGKTPFTGEDRHAISLKQVSDAPPSPRSINPKISEHAQKLVLRMMEKDPARRPQTYDELIRELSAAGGGRAAAKERPAAEARAPKTARKRVVSRAAGAKNAVPVTQIVIGAVVLLVAIILFNVVKSMGSGSESRTPAPPPPPLARRSEAPEERPASPESRRTPPEAGKREVAPSVPEPGTTGMQTKEYRRRLDLYLARLNLSGVAAAYCDAAGKSSQADELRQNMQRLEQELKAFIAELNAKGENPYIDDWIAATDELMLFDQERLDGMTPNRCMQLLGGFVSGVKAGSRARVVVRRNGEPVEFAIRFDERPKELLAIVQVATLVPSGDDTPSAPDPVVDRPGPSGGGAVSPLKDPAERAKDAVRQSLLREWDRRAGRSDFARGIALFLSRPETDLDEAAQAILAKHFAKYDPDRPMSAEEHASAAKALLAALAPIRTKPSGRMLEPIAWGHLSEACREGAAVARASAEAMGLRLSDDKRVWGIAEDLALYNLFALRADPAKSAKLYDERYDQGAGFRLAYAGLIYRMKRALAGGKAAELKLIHNECVLVGRKAPTERAKAHLDALAEGLKATGKCAACTDGMIPCPRCGGTGDIVFPKCKECGGEGWVKFTTPAGVVGTKTCPT